MNLRNVVQREVKGLTTGGLVLKLMYLKGLEWRQPGRPPYCCSGPGPGGDASSETDDKDLK